MAPLDGVTERNFAGLPLEALMPALEELPAERAISSYRDWLMANANSSQRFAAWFNLGALLAATGDRTTAMVAYRQALALKPDLHQASVNIGLLLEADGKADEALAVWEAATQSDTARTALLNQRGRLMETRKQYAEAEGALHASLLTNPDQPDVVQHWAHLRQKGCMWPLRADGIPGLSTEQLIHRGGPLGALAFTDDPALQRSIGAAWIARKIPPAPERLAPLEGYAHERIRVGYMSSDFCRHAMGFLIVALLEQHDRRQFEIFGYCSTTDDGSDLRRRIITAFDHHVPIGQLSEEAAARRIRADEIDILVDLNGLTAGARLGALRWKPAPVQATYLGYVGPVPLPELDWMICDDIVVPPDQAVHYAPRPFALSGCYQANDAAMATLPAITRVEEGLPDDAVVLCCFNNFYKITPEVFSTWMAILRQVPQALLWLTEDNATGVANLRAHGMAAGIDPGRIVFASRCDPQHYLARLQLADLFLDTFPYNAGTVASDALRMGVPIVTLAGRSFASRMASSLLTAVGMTDGIATTLEGYRDKAVAWASDPQARMAVRAAVSGGAWVSSLGDTAAFADRMEAAYRAMRVRP